MTALDDTLLAPRFFRPSPPPPGLGRDELRRPVGVGKTFPAAGPAMPWWLSPRAGRQLLQTAARVAGVGLVQVVFWKGLPVLWAVAAAYGVAR